MGFKDLIQDNLRDIYAQDIRDRARMAGCGLNLDTFEINAFGSHWRIERDLVMCENQVETGQRAVLVTMYLKHCTDNDMVLLPFRDFKELPGSMPYQEAFRARSEEVLVPHIFKIIKRFDDIIEMFAGEDGRQILGGDLSFILRPLPKIALGYVFYLPDEDFPASAKCLFSANATLFMPTDGLADVAEQTSKAILEVL